jgi:hypothetical protein
MSRISREALCRAIEKVRTTDHAQKVALADEVFRDQPNMLGSVIVLQRMGVSLEKMEFLLELLFVCFQAMRESSLDWPLITVDEQDRQSARYVATVKFGDDLSETLRDRAMHQYIKGHPEQELLAYVSVESKDWLLRIAPEESDKFVVLAAANLVNCIAFVPMPTPTRSRRK